MESTRKFTLQPPSLQHRLSTRWTLKGVIGQNQPKKWES